METYLIDYAGNLPLAGARLLILLVAVGAGWYLLNALTRFDDNRELFDKRNVAYMIQRLALVVAMIIALRGGLTYDSGDFLADIGTFAVEAVWVFVALMAARVVVDKAVLAKIPNVDELLRGNTAVATVEAGFYVGFGFILESSLTGDSPNLLTAVLSTVVFAVLGLAVSVLVYTLHERFYKIKGGIAAGKMTPALEIAGMLTAIQVVVSVGVAGDFTTWGDGLFAFGATTLIAVVVLYAARWVIDLIILRGCTVRTIQRDNLVAASGLLAGMLVAVSFPVATVVATQL